MSSYQTEKICKNDASCGDPTPLHDAKARYDEFLEYEAMTKDIRNGQGGVAGAALQYVVGERDKTGKETLKQFLGTSDKKPWTGKFEIRPDRLKLSDQLAGKTPLDYQLFRYTAAGICLNADLRGAPEPPPAFKDAKGCPGQAKQVAVRFRLDGKAKNKDQYASRIVRNFILPNDKDVTSIRYTVPAKMHTTVLDGAGAIGETRMMIAQFGLTAAVPSKLAAKAITHDLKFFDNTGALKSMTLTSSPLVTKGAVDSLSESANAVLDARNAQIEAEEEAADQLNQLERRKKILELQKEIEELCANRTDCGN